MQSPLLHMTHEMFLQTLLVYKKSLAQDAGVMLVSVMLSEGRLLAVTFRANHTFVQLLSRVNQLDVTLQSRAGPKCLPTLRADARPAVRVRDFCVGLHVFL